MKRDYAKLRALLDEQEKFPLDFIFKFIGRNSPGFRKGIQELEAGYPGLKKQSARESSGGNHLALTYTLVVQNSHEVVAVFESISRIEDVMVIL